MVFTHFDTDFVLLYLFENENWYVFNENGHISVTNGHIQFNFGHFWAKISTPNEKLSF